MYIPSTSLCLLGQQCYSRKSHRLTKALVWEWYTSFPVVDHGRFSKPYRASLWLFIAYQLLKVSSYCWRQHTFQTQDSEDSNCSDIKVLLRTSLHITGRCCTSFPVRVASVFLPRWDIYGPQEWPRKISLKV